MRIAHFLIGRCNPDSANGVEKTVYYLCKTMAKIGNDVCLFSLTNRPAIPIPGAEVKTFSPAKFRFELPAVFLGELASWRPDIVHLHSVYTPQNAILGRWLLKHGIPYVVTPNGGLSSYLSKRKWYLKIPYKYIYELPLMNGAAFVHSIADTEDIVNYGVNVPIITAPNAFDLSTLPTKLNKNALGDKFPECLGKRIFLYVGRLDPYQKGLDILLKGFSVSENKNAFLILVGPDWKGKRKLLEAMSKKLDIDSRVIFAGPSFGQEKYDFIASAHAFVHTSRWEAGLPFSVLEASAVGKPSLVTVGADPYKMILCYKAGLVVDSNVESIANGLRKFFAMREDEINTMGDNARNMVEIEFRWEKSAETLVSAYMNYVSS